MDELIKKGAVELGRLIKKGETSSEEVVKAHLERIKEVNPEINAITISLEESALELAIKSDNASKEEKARPLAWGSFYHKRKYRFFKVCQQPMVCHSLLKNFRQKMLQLLIAC